MLGPTTCDITVEEVKLFLTAGGLTVNTVVNSLLAS